MDNSGKRGIVKYLLIAFLWTWLCWGLAFWISRQNGVELVTNQTLFDLIKSFGVQGNFIAQVIFAVGVFGPVLGYIFGSNFRPIVGGLSFKNTLVVIAIPVVSILPAIILSLLFTPADGNVNLQAVLSVGLFYFLSNFITSGTEEFGWRGFLYSALKNQEKDFWDVSWKGGVIWALWHFPLMIIMYWSLGIAMISVLAGFIAGIVAMNYISNAVYEKSNSILTVMILHALNNTLSFLLILIFPVSPFIFTTALMSWAIVGIFEKTGYIKSSN